MGRRLLQNEVNAAIDGAARGGADEFVVNDAHWTMQNLLPGRAARPRRRYISGKHKPLYMMEGLDGSFDAVFMVALPRLDRGRAGDPLAHLQPVRDLRGQAQRAA